MNIRLVCAQNVAPYISSLFAFVPGRTETIENDVGNAWHLRAGLIDAVRPFGIVILYAELCLQLSV